MGASAVGGRGTIRRLLGVFGLYDRASLVLTALLAGAVGQLGLPAVRAGRDPGGSQEIVAAALGSALLGVAPFRVRHGSPLKLKSHNALGDGAENWVLQTLLAAQALLLRVSPASAFQRGSVWASPQPQSARLRLAPHFGQRPLHSSRQRARPGRLRSTCSRTASSSRRPLFS